MTKILISAGELSGDIHGAKLVSEIKKINPDIEFIGMGHHHMAAQGVRLYADLATASTVGLLEPLRYIPRILSAYHTMKRVLKTEKPDLVITIDYQGYHIPFARAAKKLGIPVVYYISPQEWQWGTEKGGRTVIDATDMILAIFKEEEAFYNRLGGNAHFIGHPIQDIVQSDCTREAFYAGLNIDPDKRILAIFPGSRPQELKHIYPQLLGAAQQIATHVSDIQVVISIASSQYAAKLRQTATRYHLPQLIFFEGNQYNLIRHAQLSLVTSGTITLEHACLGTPCIAAYRFHPISYWLIRKVIEKKFKKIRFISLPNIYMQQRIIPEFIQDQCTPHHIANEAISILSEPGRHADIQTQLKQVLSKLGPPGAAARAAELIQAFIR